MPRVGAASDRDRPGARRGSQHRALPAIAARQDYPASRLGVWWSMTIRRTQRPHRRELRRATADRLDPEPAIAAALGRQIACFVDRRPHRSAETEWLCFIDADVRAEPGVLSSAMHAALAQRLDLLSLAPRQELQSFAERLMMPCGLILLSFLQDLRQAQARSGSAVTATGQFMWSGATPRRGGGPRRRVQRDLRGPGIRAAAEAIGPIGAAHGRRAAFIDAHVYRVATLWPGLAKNLVDTLGGPVASWRWPGRP